MVNPAEALPSPLSGLAPLSLSRLEVLQLDNTPLGRPLLEGLAAATGLRQLILFNITPCLVRATGQHIGPNFGHMYYTRLHVARHFTVVRCLTPLGPPMPASPAA
jgi:hypothetical protein